jgi:protein transport protein SEC24
MSAPHDGYGQYPPQQQQPGEQPPYPDQSYADQAAPPPAGAGAAHHAPDHGKKKKRAYAAGAFEVAQGGNAAVGGQMQGGGQFGAVPAAVPGYGGYPAPEPQPALYGAQPQPQYGMAQPTGPVGGYQAPEPYYPSAGAPPAPGGVAGLAAGVSAMNLGPGTPQQLPQLPPQPRPGPLNQLYPTDLLTQPFNVSELDLPPPPIILPPNVSRVHTPALAIAMLTLNGRPASLRHRMPIAYQSTCGPL